jgi:hypothetical protein
MDACDAGAGLLNAAYKTKLAEFLVIPLLKISMHVMQIFDGHNGSGAAIYTKENLLSNILSAVPVDLNREDWLAALPRAMVAAFVKTDKDFQTKGLSRDS